MTRRAWALALAGSLLACGGEPTPAPADRSGEPTTPEPEPPPEPTLTPEQRRAAAVAELLERVEALAELHRRHAKDCPALAEAIRGFAKDHGQALAEVANEVLAKIDADAALRERMRAAMEPVMSASMACRDDPAFAAAQAEIFAAPP